MSQQVEWYGEIFFPYSYYHAAILIDYIVEAAEEREGCSAQHILNQKLAWSISNKRTRLACGGKVANLMEFVPLRS